VLLYALPNRPNWVRSAIPQGNFGFVLPNILISVAVLNNARISSGGGRRCSVRQLPEHGRQKVRRSCRPVAQALNRGDPLHPHTTQHKLVLCDDQRLLEQERIVRLVA
jgi:hypothetical protein